MGLGMPLRMIVTKATEAQIITQACNLIKGINGECLLADMYDNKSGGKSFDDTT